MEDDQKIQNGRRPKKIKMEDDQKYSKWETTKITNDRWKRNKNGKWHKNIKMEDDQKNQNGSW